MSRLLEVAWLAVVGANVLVTLADAAAGVAYLAWWALRRGRRRGRLTPEQLEEVLEQIEVATPDDLGREVERIGGRHRVQRWKHRRIGERR